MQLDDEQSETLQQHSSEVRIDVLPGSKGGRVGGRPHASSFTEGEDEALQNLQTPLVEGGQNNMVRNGGQNRIGSKPSNVSSHS